MSISTRLEGRDYSISFKDVFCSVVAAIVIYLGFVITSGYTAKNFSHWFILPVMVSGIIIGVEVVKWFRGKTDIFDPIGILSLLSFHLFFIAPLLHVSLDWRITSEYRQPDNWLPWLGGMATLNLAGILLFILCNYFFNKLFASPVNCRRRQSAWKLHQRRFLLVIGVAMAISFILQVRVYQQFGGITNYINSAVVARDGSFQGMGLMFLFSESFPILFMLLYAVLAQRHKTLQSWPTLTLVLILFFILCLFFGGLRGSRSNTIWSLFWALGIIHFTIRHVSKQQIALGICFLLLFMYTYGFYKAGGLDTLNSAFSGSQERSSVEAESGRTWQALLLADFGRSDVQAAMLYLLSQPNNDYQYAFGKTYLAGVSILLPRPIRPNIEPDKIEAGTNLFFGHNSYDPVRPRTVVSSKVYGLAGESMLNFGPLSAPYAAIPFAVLINWINNTYIDWKQSKDVRILLLPALINFGFIVLISDTDNNTFFLLKNISFPLLILFLGSRKVKPSVYESPNF
jgi:hypothetical protein